MFIYIYNQRVTFQQQSAIHDQWLCAVQTRHAVNNKCAVCIDLGFMRWGYLQVLQIIRFSAK